MARHSATAPDAYSTFLRRLPLALVAGLLLWWVMLRPASDHAVAFLAQTLIRAFEVPKVTRLVVEDHRAEIHRSDFRSDSKIPTVALTEIHFNTIVLLTLFFALPRPLSRRQLERLVMAFSALLLTQSLNLVFHVKTLYALGLGEWSRAHYGVVSQNVYGFLQYFFDLPGRFSFPFLFWLGFNWEVVLSLVLRREPTGESQPKPRKAKA